MPRTPATLLLWMTLALISSGCLEVKRLDTAEACGVDDDGDGHVDQACAGGTDCDDGDPDVHPGAAELCGDGLDNDCDGLSGACGHSGEQSLDGGADAVFNGEHTEAFAGNAVATAGNVNGAGRVTFLLERTTSTPTRTCRARGTRLVQSTCWLARRMETPTGAASRNGS